MEVESVLRRLSTRFPSGQGAGAATHVADTPGDGALLACCGRLVGLTLNALYLLAAAQQHFQGTSEPTQVHDVISANGAVVDNNVPRPQRNSIPLNPSQPHLQGPQGVLCTIPTFFTSNFFFPSVEPSAAALEVLVLAGAVGASAMSTSAMAPVTVGLR